MEICGKLFPYIAVYFNIFQYRFPSISIYFHTFSIYFNMFQYTSICFNMFLYFPFYLNIPLYLSIGFHIFPNLYYNVYIIYYNVHYMNIIHTIYIYIYIYIHLYVWKKKNIYIHTYYGRDFGLGFTSIWHVSGCSPQPYLYDAFVVVLRARAKARKTQAKVTSIASSKLLTWLWLGFYEHLEFPWMLWFCPVSCNR